MTLLKALRVLVISIFFGFSLAPLVWMVLSALKSRFDITSTPPSLQFTPTLMNFRALAENHDLLRLMAVGGGAAILSSTLCLSLAAPTAYALARRYSAALRGQILLFLLATRLTPVVALSLPLFVTYSTLRLRGTFGGIVLAHVAASLPIAIWLLVDAFHRLPLDVERAASLDGLTETGFFWRILLPVSRSALAAAALLCFLFSWNDYVLVTILSTRSTRTLSAELPVLITQGITQWGQLCAGMVALMGPAIIVGYATARLLLVRQYAGALKKD